MNNYCFDDEHGRSITALSSGMITLQYTKHWILQACYGSCLLRVLSFVIHSLLLPNERDGFSVRNLNNSIPNYHLLFQISG